MGEKEINQRTVDPGELGSKKRQKRSGDRLLCVRYEYDDQNEKRITAIELIVDEPGWKPNKTIIPENKIVHL